MSSVGGAPARTGFRYLKPGVVLDRIAVGGSRKALAFFKGVNDRGIKIGSFPTSAAPSGQKVSRSRGRDGWAAASTSLDATVYARLGPWGRHSCRHMLRYSDSGEV